MSDQVGVVLGRAGKDADDGPVRPGVERSRHSVHTRMDTCAHLLPAMDRDAADAFAEVLRVAEG